ncbi:MAG: protein kinase, partial [Planctomycetota bacterium]
MKLGRYETIAPLASGGAGAVFRARGPDGREVALKVLARRDEAARVRFEREGRLLRELGALEGFVPLLDAGTSPDGVWIVMPLVPGGTLRDRLR